MSRVHIVYPECTQESWAVRSQFKFEFRLLRISFLGEKDSPKNEILESKRYIYLYQ
jgi:hypothetical protein